MESTTVLGLSINTRMLGLAVIKGNLLLDYHIQLRKEPWTPRKKELILTSLQPWCKSYNINRVALSIPYEKQTSKSIRELLESIKNYFKERKINLHLYHTKTLYTFCEGSETKTKKEVMRNLTLMFPELTYYYRKEVGNKNKYYIKLFEAVGVATLVAGKVKRS